MYKAVCVFRDLTDNHLYQAGDVFPHDGRGSEEERVNTLINGHNKANKPLIEKVEEPIVQEQKTRKRPARAAKKGE